MAGSSTLHHEHLPHRHWGLGDPRISLSEPGVSRGRESRTKGVSQQVKVLCARGEEGQRGTQPRVEMGVREGASNDEVYGEQLGESYFKDVGRTSPWASSQLWGNYEDRRALPTQGRHPRPGLELSVRHN